MKMLPVQLSLNPPIGLWSDVLWRHPPSIPNPLVELKTHLPPQLPPDPKLWSRDDVSIFLKFCEREFDLPKFEYDLFQMNGKALCLLNRTDFGERCPGAGDVLHNVLQMLVRESQMLHRHLPSSPVTPTSRYPLSPHSHPSTPTWPTFMPTDSSAFHNAHLHQFIQPNSVTLSPAPSIDSQTSSPPQNQDQLQTTTTTTASTTSNYINKNITNSSSSNHSDSDEDNFSDGKNQTAGHGIQFTNQSSPNTLKDGKHSLSQQQQQQVDMHLSNAWSNHTSNQKLQSNSNISNGGSVSAPTTPNGCMPNKREFFPDNGETNTNGRLLWDFLQQLLNDRNQKYSYLITWKCRDTGVFKIVDPAGLAKLWGIQKNHLSMNYDKMSRALRYYYRVNILRKVQGERHCYQFLRNPTELKNIKNISLLRQSTANSNIPEATSNNTKSITPSSTSSSQCAQANSLHQYQSMSVFQSQQHSPQIPQGPSSSSANNGNQFLQSTSISNSAAAAAVAAAAAAAYGPAPTSPLFMHAMNGAFQYLSNASQPPHSPVLPPTPSEKLQFSSLKIENSQDADDMKPTDLSIGGMEKRSYQEPSNDCFPLIRCADGLTTIKLIRFNENDNDTTQSQPLSPKSLGGGGASGSSSDFMQQNRNSSSDDMAQYAMTCKVENSSEIDENLIPTDLRK